MSRIEELTGLKISQKGLVLAIGIAVLSISAAFGSGYIMGRDANPAPIIIEQN